MSVTAEAHFSLAAFHWVSFVHQSSNPAQVIRMLGESTQRSGILDFTKLASIEQWKTSPDIKPRVRTYNRRFLLRSVNLRFRKQALRWSQMKVRM